jgi:CheY-like chemotaxis protein
MVSGGVPIRVLYVDALSSGSLPTAGLEGANLDLTVVTSAEDALSAVADGYDCVVCGATLPDADGFALVERLRARATVPVVLVGDAPAAEAGPRALEVGAAEYVTRTTLREARDLFVARVRRVAVAGSEDGDGLLDRLPVPVVAGDETLYYANDAAHDCFDTRDSLVGARVTTLFADLAALSDLSNGGPDTVQVLPGPRAMRAATTGWSGSALTCCVLTSESPASPRDLPVDEANLLDSLLSSLPVSLYVKDREGRHVLASDALTGTHPEAVIVNAENKVHHTATDVLGKTDFDLYGATTAAETVEDDNRVMETEEPVVGKTERTVDSEGRPMTLWTAKAPWYDDEGEVAGLVGLTVEVTEETSHAAAVTHAELVLSLVSTVLGEHVSPAVEALRETASAESLADLRDHLEYAATLVEHGSFEPGNELVDVATTVRDVWTSLDTRDATLSVDCEGVVRADRDAVESLLTVLLDNAVRHGGEGVGVTVARTDEGLTFVDDGPGIPSNVRERAFEYDVSTTDDRRGRGLPLATVVAGSLGWSLSLTDAAGGGCRVALSGLDFGGGRHSTE